MLLITSAPLLAVLLVLPIFGGACAANGAPAGPQVGNQREWLEVRVENGTPNTLRVFALLNGAETLIGRVDGLSDRLLRVPAFAAGMVRLVARPAVDMQLDRGHVSEPISLQPGQRVTWNLRPSPGVSDVPRMSTIKVQMCGAAEC